jgi:serine/threonine protein kinase
VRICTPEFDFTQELRKEQLGNARLQENPPTPTSGGGGGGAASSASAPARWGAPAGLGVESPEGSGAILLPPPAPDVDQEEPPRLLSPPPQAEVELELDALLSPSWRAPSAAAPEEPAPAPSSSEGILERSGLLTAHKSLRFDDYYEVGAKAGEGSFGDVYQAWARPWPSSSSSSTPGGAERQQSASDAPRRQVAVKIFQLTKPGETATPRVRQQDAKKRASFEAERAMLASLEHPHIVRMYECFEEGSTYYIVLELCRGGELYKRLVQRIQDTGTGGFEEPLCRVFLRQMLFGLAYLHAKRVVHRDVKTENFLLVGEAGSPEEDVVKLCDFGTSALLSDQKPRSMDNIGTLSYTAPEVYANKGAAVAADAWSLGVVLYILLTGANPFRLPGHGSRDEVVERIRTGTFETRRKVWQQVASAGQDLVRHLLMVDEHKRLTCVQALRHCWFADATRGGYTGLSSSLDAALCSPREVLGHDPMAEPFGGGSFHASSPSAGSAWSPSRTPHAGSRSPREDGLVHGPPDAGAFGDARLEVPSPVAHHLAEHGAAVAMLLLRLPRLAAAQRVALTACALAASEADLGPAGDLWRELFLTLDADQDGRLSFEDVANGLRRLARAKAKPGGGASQVPDDRLEACIRALDLDQNGSIEWTEWFAVALLGSPGAFRRPEPAGTAFRLLDRPLYHRRKGEAGGDEIGPPIMMGDLIRDWAPKRMQCEGSGAEEVEFEAVSLQALAAEADDGEGFASELLPTRGPFSVADLQLVLTSLEVYEML